MYMNINKKIIVVYSMYIVIQETNIPFITGAANYRTPKPLTNRYKTVFLQRDELTSPGPT